MIHTSTVLGSLERDLADDDIIVNKGMMQSGCRIGDIGCSHFRGFEVFNLTVTKEYRLIASSKKNGTYIKLDGKDRAPIVVLKEHECLVGFYNTGFAKNSTSGSFTIELPGKLFGKSETIVKIARKFRSFMDHWKSKVKNFIKKKNK